LEKIYEKSVKLHRRLRGKIRVRSKISIKEREMLSLIYTPGVAGPCIEIERRPLSVFDLTSKWNNVAVVTDGSRVLGLGNIGAEASIPVMEGKALLFSELAGINAFPICLRTQEEKEIVNIVVEISPIFGGINLEDIESPKCFYIEERLRERLTIPVFHDDQHGTAVVTFAALINACRYVGKTLEDLRVVINGAGAAGIAIAHLLLQGGVRDIILCDRAGILYSGRRENMNKYKIMIAEKTNRSNLKGSLEDALIGADVFIGVSGPRLLKPEMIRLMDREPIIFALANPVPEITPEEAYEGGAKIVATGRSDYPNQVNNLLGFPGIFRGALDVRATEINDEMKLAASYAIAESVSRRDLERGVIIPEPLDREVVVNVAERVAEAAVRSGVARTELRKGDIRERLRRLLS